MNINSSKLAQWGQGTMTQEVLITGIKVDNRLVEQGDLFVCLRGAQVDGHKYAQGAIDQGAVCLLVDHKLDIDIPQIIVEDTLKAFIEMGKNYRRSLDVFIIGITGSNGKTSTKDIINAILDNSIATHMNQNTEIGTLLNIFKMDEGTRYGVFEIGLDMPGDVDAIASILEPDAAMVTSLAPAHMANFDSIEHIADQKFRIFNYVANKDLCFYQGDFENYRAIANGQHSFGFNTNNEFVASDVVMNNEGIEFKVNSETYKCNLLGEHQASNCAGVIALMKALKIDEAVVKQRLQEVNLTALRTEIINYNQALLLMDAYKSNASSLTYALDILKTYDYTGPKVAFLSDMVELGDLSQSEHIKILNYISDINLDHVYTLGNEFAKAIEGSNLDPSKFSNKLEFNDFKTEFKEVTNNAVMVLVKGSRSFALERLVKED